METDEVARELARLQQRLSLLEDREAIGQLMASYGPAVDSGSAAEASALWTEDGIYDTFPKVLEGAEAVHDMVHGQRHQQLIHDGCAHLIGVPHIVVDGDSAVATCYAMLICRDHTSDRFWIWRTAANRWEFARTEHGWRVTRRVNRLLDGDEAARALLRPAAAQRDFA